MLRVRNPFFVGARRYLRGELVADDDPVVAGRERLFEPADGPDLDVTGDAARNQPPSDAEVLRTPKKRRGSPASTEGEGG